MASLEELACAAGLVLAVASPAIVMALYVLVVRLAECARERERLRKRLERCM